MDPMRHTGGLRGTRGSGFGLMVLCAVAILASVGAAFAQGPATPESQTTPPGPLTGQGGPPGPARQVPSDAAVVAPQEGTTPAAALEVRTSSLLQHRLGEWTTLDIRATNPTSVPIEALVAVLFEGGTRQYARRLWVPAKGDRSTWLPIRVPAETLREGAIEYTRLVLDADADREILSRREGDSLTSTELLRISDDPVRSSLILPRPILPATPREEAIRDGWPRALAAARLSRGLNTTSPLLVPDFLPPWHMTSRGLDVLLLASDRLESDTAGLAALRSWVRDGGRLWIALDAVAPETVTSILGHDTGIEVVDRVELDAFTMATGDATNPAAVTDQFDLEVPVEMVRVITSHADVPSRVEGWPAAIWVPCGQGDVLITTVGPRAWVGADGTTPIGATRALATRLLAGRPDRLDADRFRPSLEQQIGYATPSRGVAAAILGLFCAAILAAGWRWGARRRLDNLAWFVPLASVAATGILALVGMASSRSVSPTIASGTLLRLEPATGEVIIDGNAAVYDQQSRPVAWTGRRRTWVLPDASQGTNGERVVWLDDDQETTTNTTTHAGSIDRLTIRGATSIIPGIAVTGRFGPGGLEGAIDAGPLSAIRDPAIVGMPGPALAVTLAGDGSFTAGVGALMAPEQYNPSPLLTDDARWRQAAVRRLLQSPEDFATESGRRRSQTTAGIGGTSALRRRPWMLFWCDLPSASPGDMPEGFAERSSTLGIAPIDLARTPSGTPFRIPSTFLPIRLGDGTQGRSNAFDVRRGEWVKGLTTPTETLLRFQLPDAVLPCTLDAGRLVLRINAPSREVEVSAFQGDKPAPLLKVGEPNGVYEIALRPEHLTVDRGAVPIAIQVSLTKAERAEAAKRDAPEFNTKEYQDQIDSSASSTWEIDYVRLSVDGRTN